MSLPSACSDGVPPFPLQIAPEARDLIQRLMCDVDDRLGTNGVHEIKVRCLLDLEAALFHWFHTLVSHVSLLMPQWQSW
jgi:hypothetical protein